MSTSLYPVLERDVVGYDASAVIGKALCHAVYHCDVPEVVALDAFFSVSPQELASLAGFYLPGDDLSDHEDTELKPLKPAPPDFQPPAEAWYEPAVGLRAVSEALKALRDASPLIDGQLEAGKNRTDWVITDLEAVEKVLTLAQEHEVRFHFAMDY